MSVNTNKEGEEELKAGASSTQTALGRDEEATELQGCGSVSFGERVSLAPSSLHLEFKKGLTSGNRNISVRNIMLYPGTLRRH